MKNSFWKKFLPTAILPWCCCAVSAIVVIIVFSFANNSNFTFDNGFSFDATCPFSTVPNRQNCLPPLKIP